MYNPIRRYRVKPEAEYEQRRWFTSDASRVGRSLPVRPRFLIQELETQTLQVDDPHANRA